MKRTIFLALALAGIQSASAEFFNPAATRSVNLYAEVDGDPVTNPQIDVFGNPDGFFDPPNLSISDSGNERGSGNGSINHQSNLSLGSTSLTASLTDIGAATSAPANGHRGTLSIFSQLHLGFVSDTPFTFTLTANFGSGSAGNAFNPGEYGVRFRDASFGTTLAFYDLANPSGTTTLELPAGSYVLDSLSGMSFDAVFGNPPALGYNSTFDTNWSFSATPTPEPSSAVLLLSGAALCLRRRSLRTNGRNA